MSIDIHAFTAGITRLALAARQAIDEGTFEVYHEAVGHETDADEWEAFTLHCVRTDRFTWFPRVSELREALHEFRGAPRLQPEATAAYERVIASGEYSAEGGTTWSFRRVLELCGIAAAEAFLAAGGNSAFQTTWDEAKRRERFLAAYQLAARQDPGTRALPAPTVLAIEGEVETAGPVDGAAAAQAMREIRERLGVKVEPAKAPVVIATDERLAELRRQAEQLNDMAAHVAEEV